MASSQVTRWAPIAQEAQRKYGVPANVLLALIQTESSGLEGQVSSANAQGLTQFIPSTAKSYGVDVRPGHARSQIFGTAKYLLALGFKRDPAKALASYAGGPGNPQYGYATTIDERARLYQAFAAGQARAPSAGATPTASPVTTPGVDTSGAQGSLIADFIQGRGNNLDFALGLRALRDQATPATTSPAASTPVRSSARPQSGGPEGRGGYAYPLAARGKIIGTPYSGTHTLGNWQSDNAVDISIPVGTPVRSIQDGVVVKVVHHPQDGSRFAGDQITIQGPGGGTFFTHLSHSGVQPGERVRRGQVIGRSGSANGVAHLHIGRERGNPQREFG